MPKNASVAYDGRNFYRYDGNPYFWTKHFPARGRSTSLHVYVWEKHHGPRPSGWHVHHQVEDFATTKVGDLELVERRAHARMHMRERARRGELVLSPQARKAAAEWHASAEGRAWHAAHARDAWKDRTQVRATCAGCGKQHWTYFKRRRNWCSAVCQQRVWRQEH